MLISTVIAEAQVCHLHISGSIRDAENALPVSYVVVGLKETSSAASSDSLGNFHLDGICAGKTYTLVCSRIGFQTIERTIQITNDTIIDFSIEFNPAAFKTVDVIADAAPKQNTQVSSELVGTDLFKTRGNNLGESLKSVTGITTLNTGAGISKPAIHGLHSNRVLILNNGVRQEGQQWGNEHAPEIDPFIADKVTVIKGASSLRYGADAIAGVILVEPRELGTKKGLSGEINLVGMSNGRQGITSGFLEYKPAKFNGLSARIQGTLKQGGNFKTANYFLKNTGIDEQNFSGAVAYKKKRFEATVYYSQFNTRVGIFSAAHIGNLTDLSRAIASETPLESADFSYNIDRPHQKITHELFKADGIIRLNKIGNIHINYARQYNIRYEYDKHKPLNDSLAALDLPALQLEITTHTADIVWEKKMQSGWKHEAGINWLHQANTYTGRYFIPNYYNNGLGFFLIESLQLKKWKLEAGLRYDVRDLDVFLFENKNWTSYNHNYANVSSSIAAHFQPSDKWNILLQAGTAWRPPQASELYSNGLHHGVAAIENGNRNLNEERSYSVISSIEYRNEKLTVEVSPYINYMSGFMLLSPAREPTLTIRGAFPTFNYTQTDASLMGADVQVKYALHRNIGLKAKTSLLRAKDKHSKEYLFGMPSDRYEIGVEYALPKNKTFDETLISFHTQYVNKQWRTNSANDFMHAPDAYSLFGVDITTTLHFGKQSIKAGISVSNAFNTAYRDYMNRFRYYADDMGRNIALRISIPIESHKNNS